MDSLTHIVVGAGLGDALLGKKAGKKTMFWGAFMSTVPDFDVFPTLFMNPVDGMHFHRGFFHSLLFYVLSAPLFGLLIHKIYKGKIASWREWTVFCFIMLCGHSFLDSFTNYGTRVFVPIDYHVSFNTLFILDPLFTLPTLIAFIVLLVYKNDNIRRRRINYAALMLTAAYLIMSIVNKEIVNNVFEEALAKQNIQYKRYSTKPTPLNNILWTAMAETEDGYYLGYYSFLDADRDIKFQFIKRDEQLLDGLPESEQLKTLIHMTDGYYCVRKQEDNRLMIHDLRFGQATNFASNTGKFVFSFYLDKKGNGNSSELEITQKIYGFNDMEDGTFSKLWKRILGEEKF